MRIIAFTGILAVVSYGQTQVDLHNQSKNIDFSTAPFTRPVKTGTVLPATCGVGDLFFKTNGLGGQNLYGCVSANTWALQSGGSELTLFNNGIVIGARSGLDFVGGYGIQNTVSDADSKMVVQQGVDTAVILSNQAAQGNGLWKCASSGGSVAAFTCPLTPTLNTYTAGMVLHWIPDVNGAGGPTTLNVDTLGAKAIKQMDGSTDPTSTDIVAGYMYPIWYDGTSFRLLAPLPGSGTQPTCNASRRGRIWYVPGNTGVKDSLAVCGKDASNNYAWRTIY